MPISAAAARSRDRPGVSDGKTRDKVPGAGAALIRRKRLQATILRKSVGRSTRKVRQRERGLRPTLARMTGELASVPTMRLRRVGWWRPVAIAIAVAVGVGIAVVAVDRCWHCRGRCCRCALPWPLPWPFVAVAVAVGVGVAVAMGVAVGVSVAVAMGVGRCRKRGRCHGPLPLAMGVARWRKRRRCVGVSVAVGIVGSGVPRAAEAGWPGVGPTTPTGPTPGAAPGVAPYKPIVGPFVGEGLPEAAARVAASQSRLSPTAVPATRRYW